MPVFPAFVLLQCYCNAPQPIVQQKALWKLAIGIVVLANAAARIVVRDVVAVLLGCWSWRGQAIQNRVTVAIKLCFISRKLLAAGCFPSASCCVTNFEAPAAEIQLDCFRPHEGRRPKPEKERQDG
tara:strand:- start:132 stop:509 length:378 start_codon:yes stop_codon:yes gene_type:complete